MRGIADALEEAGYQVDLFGDEIGNRPASETQSDPLRKAALRLSHSIDHLFTADTYLRQLGGIEWERVAAVICYPGTAALVWRLLRVCRGRRIPFILDVVEWYKPSDTPLGRFGPFALDSEFRMRWLHQRAGNLICISSYLARFYRNKGCNVVCVPPIIGKANAALAASLPSETPPVRQVSLVYAGVPGGKELFAEIIAGVQAARRRSINVVFRVVGATEAYVAELLRKGGRGPVSLDGIQCYGRLPHVAAMGIVAASDFATIVRPQERFAIAGFPTKFVESLSLGVPVIANATSDIAEYLRDGQEGYLLDEPSAAAVEKAIVRAWERTPEQCSQMRNQARLRARECFDYRRYSRPLQEFLAAAQPLAHD